MPIRLLVIEDEVQICQNLTELLRMTGFEVTTAPNGVSGITKALQQLPDLILCDIMMPDMDGYQVLETIRTNPALAYVPFIFLTAKADMMYLRRGMNLGADDYITKPFVFKDLLTSITSRLKRHQQQKPESHSSATFLKTIRGHDDRGYMILQTEDCFYFYIQNRSYVVRHYLGTFQIDLTFDKLADELDPRQFFRVNRHVILHRKTVQKYTYWEKGKYCLFLDIAGQPHEAILPRARFNSFKTWLSS